MEFKKYTKRIKVNGVQVTARIVVEVEDNEDATILMDQDFENDSQRKKYQARIENEEIFAGVIRVRAFAEGLEGTDSLGGCEFKTNNMFNSKPFENSVKSYLKEYDMEKNALKELKRNLESEYTYLQVRSEAFKKYSK